MNFTREQYLDAVEKIKERIRCGDTYQTNLTQRFDVQLAPGLTPSDVFWRIRRDHPAPFAAFFTRPSSTVVSASPERFFRLEGSRITTSPIKGTRPRSTDSAIDERLRQDLLKSEKDIAENTMIVDLLRNDLGRVCEYGSVEVEKLCDLEEHPTLFHLVSTVSGSLRTGIEFSDILRSLFPCGSITGAPKISTMRIIDEIEPTARGLSMGAIGYSIPAGFGGLDAVTELSVAIRTMVIRDGVASFNVGGGIVIDSDPGDEYEEMLTKSKALLAALGAVIPT
jgi:para-aminobenzoate synthetase component 1